MTVPSKYDSYKNIIIIDVMIFKRFSLQRKKRELCYICEQEMLKSNFFSKNNKKFSKCFFEINTGLGYFILTA